MFPLFVFQFLLPFSFFCLVFFITLPFFTFVCLCFSALVGFISSLPQPLGLKGLVVVVFLTNINNVEKTPISVPVPNEL
jgi:hypothetical protein